MDNPNLSTSKILVISPTSLVGSRFVTLVAEKWEVHGAGLGDELVEELPLASFQKLDILDSENVAEVIRNFNGKYVINFAGATDVSKIEETRPEDPFNKDQLEANLAYKINVIGTKNIIEACQEYDKFPIFISTDFIFDGKLGPYDEDAEMANVPEDVSWYAWTKILAEQEVKKSDIKSLTLRISYPYRKEFPLKGDIARNFLDLYDKSLRGEANLYPVFADQFFTPTFIDDLANAFFLLSEKDSEGIFNIASPEVANFYDFFSELLRIARGVESPELILEKGSIIKYFEENPGVAKWPKKGGLKSDKITALGFVPTNWNKGIQKIYGE